MFLKFNKEEIIILRFKRNEKKLSNYFLYNIFFYKLKGEKNIQVNVIRNIDGNVNIQNILFRYLFIKESIKIFKQKFFDAKYKYSFSMKDCDKFQVQVNSFK